jgi:hypothetical protein
MKKMTLVLSVGLLILSTGCSRLDIAFRWADTYIASKVDDYFDISSKQSKDLKKDIQKDLNSIKVAMLPNWIDRLQGIQKDVDSAQLNEEQVAIYFTGFMKDVDQITSHFSTTAVDFIATTNPDQIEYFKKSFHKKNQEDLEKAQNVSKLRKEYRDKYEEWFEMFLGSLTKEQRQLMEDNLEKSPFPAELKAKNKDYVFQKFFEHKGSVEEMKAFVREYYTNPEKYDMPEYRQAFVQYQKDLQKLVTQILTTMTDKQKAALKDSINEKTAQLRSIAMRS